MLGLRLLDQRGPCRVLMKAVNNYNLLFVDINNLAQSPL